MTKCKDKVSYIPFLHPDAMLRFKNELFTTTMKHG